MHLPEQLLLEHFAKCARRVARAAWAMIRHLIAFCRHEVRAHLRDRIALNMDPELALIAADHRALLLLAVIVTDDAVALLLMKRGARLAEAVIELPTAAAGARRVAAFARHMRRA